MVHQTWTTTEQKDWLETQKAAFLEAKQKGNSALKEFFSETFKEFQMKWPVVEDESTEAGSRGLATKKKCDKYNRVCIHLFILNL